MKSKQQAEEFAKDRIELLKEMLDPRTDVYTEAPLSPLQCRWENLPEIIYSDQPWGFYRIISFYSQNRNMLGSCSYMKELLKTQYLILYCEKSYTLYFVKHFQEDKLPWKTTPVMTCDNS